jgi:hypothetical protein
LLRAPLGTSILSSRTVDKAMEHETAAFCALCCGITPLREMHPVAVVSRTIPLFIHAEHWCEGCATLAYGVHLFRHATLPKEAR